MEIIKSRLLRGLFQMFRWFNLIEKLILYPRSSDPIIGRCS